MSPKSILVILSYTFSKLVRFETQCTSCTVTGNGGRWTCCYITLIGSAITSIYWQLAQLPPQVNDL